MGLNVSKLNLGFLTTKVDNGQEVSEQNLNGNVKVEKVPELKPFSYSPILNLASVGEIQSVFLPSEFSTSCPNVQSPEIAQNVVGLLA